MKKRRGNRAPAAHGSDIASGSPSISILAALSAFALAIRLLYLWQIREAPSFTLLMGDSKGYDE